jgi:diguanylate cyclase (GGDEF)-like protein
MDLKLRLEAGLSLEQCLEIIDRQEEKIRQLEEERQVDQERIKKWEEEAGVDFLTAVNNRRGFEKTAGKLVQEIFMERVERRRERRLAFLFLDIDDFKIINDTYDHFYGDQVLQQAAEFLRMNAIRRNQDVVSRWGGEEFVIIYPFSTAAAIQRLFLRSRENGAQLGFVAEFDTEDAVTKAVRKVVIPVTFSGGLTDYDQTVDSSWEDALHRASLAMKAAKRAGKNRILKYPARPIRELFPELI